MGGINSKYLSLELIFMFLKFNKINDKLIVALVGELDHHSSEEVRVKIDDRIERLRNSLNLCFILLNKITKLFKS